MDQSIARKQENFNVMTAILAWAGMVVMCSLYITIPLISIFSNHFQITSSDASNASSVFSIGFAIGCFFYGAISEKYGRKNVIVFGLLLLTLFTFLIGIVNDFSLLMLFRLLQGLAAASFSPVALAYTLEVFPANKKVSAVGFISTGFLVAGIIGQVFSRSVSEYANWNTVFYILAIVYLVTALLVWRYLPQGTPANMAKKIWEPLKRLPAVFTNRNLLFSYCITIVILLSFVSMYIILDQYLASDSFNISSQQFIVLRLFGIIGMVLSPFAGKLAAKSNVLFVLRCSLLLAIASLIAMGFITNITVLTIISVVFVSGIALAVPSLISLVGRLGGKDSGIAVSMYTVILFAGTSIAPQLSLLFINTGSFVTAFLLLAATLGIGFVASLFIRQA